MKNWVSGFYRAFRRTKSWRVTLLATPVSRHFLSVIIFSILKLTALRSPAAHAQQVWFAPPDNMDRGARTFNHDFPQLFESPAAWDGKTDVFVLSPKFAE